MATRAELKRRAKNRAAEIGARRAAEREKAGAAPARRSPSTRERRVPGLRWLLNKNKIGPREFQAGEDYGTLFRVAAMEGFVAIKSCLNDEQGSGRGGGALPPLDLDAAAWGADCRKRLAEAQVNILQNHAGLIAALACVCGRGETPREILGASASDREVEDLTSSLRTALQMLANKWGI